MLRPLLKEMPSASYGALRLFRPSSLPFRLIFSRNVRSLSNLSKVRSSKPENHLKRNLGTYTIMAKLQIAHIPDRAVLPGFGDSRLREFHVDR